MNGAIRKTIGQVNEKGMSGGSEMIGSDNERGGLRREGGARKHKGDEEAGEGAGGGGGGQWAAKTRGAREHFLCSPAVVFRGARDRQVDGKRR